ncbi:MAG: hypothetical protein WCI76_02520 [bacterium]
MPRNLLQDMVKTKRATVRMAPLEKESIAPKHIEHTPIEVYGVLGGKQKGKSRHTLWIVAVVCLLFFAFSISYLFFSATITVHPKFKDVALNSSFSATSNSMDPLPFNVIVVSGEEDKTLQATETKDVLQKAQGSVVIYNNFGLAPQKLAVATKLLASSGKIYKIKTAIEIPGMKGGVPGSIEVGIEASEDGEAYNSGPLDFNILGFKDTPKYSKFYARSKGSLAGGFKGVTPFISDTEKTSTLAAMKASLQQKLLQKATDQIPAGFILFKDAVFLNIDDSNIDFNSHDASTVPLALKGTLYGVLFDEQKLTNKIVKDNVKNSDGSSEVYIPNIKDLSFSLAGATNASNFNNLESIDFNLKGQVKIVWKLDQDKFVSDLLGASKKDFNKILLQYTSIDSAELVISPFWKSSLPSNSKDIKVLIVDLK